MIKNKRNFFIAIIMTLLSFVAFIIYMKTNEYRYFITMLVGIFYAMIQYYQAFSTSIFEELKIYNDERDDFIIMKTSHLLLRIMNYILFIMVFIFLMSYALFGIDTLLIISLTLIGILVFIFLRTLFINIYLEKRN